MAKTAADNETSIFVAGVSEEKALRIREVTPPLDIVSLNEAEACALLECNTFSEDALITGGERYGIRNLVVTKGNDGYLVGTPESVREFPAIQLSSIVSTSGTGDAFLAGICHAVHEEGEIDWDRFETYISPYIEDVVSYEGSTPGATAKEIELSVPDRVNRKARSIAGHSWWEIVAMVIGVIGAILTILSVLVF